MRPESWSQDTTETPLKETIRSPARSPDGVGRGLGVPLLAGLLAAGGGDHALAHRRHRGGLGAAPVDPEDRPEDQEGQQKIGEDPAAHHHQPLPDRLLTEQAAAVGIGNVLPLGRAGLVGQPGEPVGATPFPLRRVHPDQLDVPAQRNPLEPVLGLPPASRPDPWAEAGEELGHLDAEDLGRDEMAALVQQHGHDDEREEHQRAQDLQQHSHGPKCDTRLRRSGRPQTTPIAITASATLVNPAILAPRM
jgi:hypothetical protein